MTNGSNDRLDRIEQLLESFITASITDRQSSDERMTRLEQSLEQSFNRNSQLLERVLRVQERTLDTQERTLQEQRRQAQQNQILLDAATRHEATIARLDAILERLIYREGRGNGDQPQP